jgi:type I restriction enzyme S subunit
MTVQQVPLGEVLHRVTRAVKVDASSTYSNVGVLNRARGVFEKPKLRGAETKYKTLYRLAAGDLVYSKLFGWEGAVALVPDWADGACVSGEFPTYSLSSRINTDYLGHVIAWEGFASQMAASTTGMGQRRQRVNPDQFERIMIPLPGVTEQVQIAAYLDRIAGVARAVLGRSTVTYASALSAIDSTVEKLQRGAGPEMPLREVADVNPRRVRVTDDQVAFVPMAAVDDETGKIAHSQVRAVEEVRKGYTQFRRGDVIFARITPCMQNGKSAIFNEPCSEFGFGSTEFHVIRPNPGGPTATWLHAVFRSQWFKQAAQVKFSGTAGQQRVSAAAFKELPVPVPTDDHATELLGRLARLEASRHSLHSLVAERTKVAAALLPAARNEAFAELT